MPFTETDEAIDLDFSGEKIPTNHSQLTQTRSLFAKKSLSIEKTAKVMEQAFAENVSLTDSIESLAAHSLKNFFELGRYLHLEVSAIGSED